MKKKNVYIFSFRAIKLFKFQKNTFGMRNTQYSIELSVHKQPSVFNTTYTIQSRVNCLIVFILVTKITSKKVCEKNGKQLNVGKGLTSV